MQTDLDSSPVTPEPSDPRRTTVLVTGARGMLGADVCALLAKRYEVRGVDIDDFDLTDAPAVRSALAEHRPGIVVHCGAWTDVDGCERDPARAFEQNARATGHVAAACADIGASLVYISTDFVFDGSKGEPYTEFDQPNPLSAYGASKLAGEHLVQSLVPQHYIVRSAWLYGVKGRHFVRAILEKSVGKDEIDVVADQFGSPTYARDLAHALVDIIVPAAVVPGIYHVVNGGACSWAELAAEALRLAGRPTRVRPISSTAWPSPTRRPPYSALRSRWFELQGIPPLREWRDALISYIKDST